MIPSREKILAKIPDYAVDIEPIAGDITVRYGETIIAETKGAETKGADPKVAYLVRETRHADVIYLPREALRDEYFSPTDHSTYCPFKGHANYWQLKIGDLIEDNIVWSYEHPYDEVQALKDYVSFYTDRTEIDVRP